MSRDIAKITDRRNVLLIFSIHAQPLAKRVAKTAVFAVCGF